MNHLMSLPRHQAVMNLTLRRLLSSASCGPTPPTPGHPTKTQHPEMFTNSCGDSETLSRSQANSVWKSLQIINSTFSQVQNGGLANLTSNHTELDNKILSNQAVTHLKQSLLAHETSQWNNCLTEELKKLNFQFSDKNKYLSNWNCLLNNTYDGIFGCKSHVLPHLKQPLGPWTQCLREFHSTTAVRRRKAPLIPYTPPSNTLGLTYISDLNAEDGERIKNVAYEELKNLLTSHNIQFTKVSPRKRASVHGLFGSALEALVHKDIKRERLITDMKVPAVFLMMVRFLEENGLESEGIFRLSGSSDRVKSLRRDLEENFYTNPVYSLYRVQDITVHDVASVFKAFLRELPASLVSSERLEIFPDISGLPLKEQIKATNMFILSMREEHRDTLQVFLRLISAIIEKKSVTKMDDSNLATCLTPNIFAMPKFSQPSAEQEFNKLQEQFGYFRILATYHKKLFVVPPEFLSQIRQQYATGASVKPKKKFISKLLGKKKGLSELPPPRDELMRLTEAEIEIHAPHLQKEHGVVRVNASMTAQDVLQAYGLEPKDMMHELRRKLEELGILDEDRAIDYLVESGGNIGERCLDPNTKVLDVYKVNPTAEWMIKCKKGR